MRRSWEDEKAWHHDRIHDANMGVIDAIGLLEIRVIAARKIGIPWQTIAAAVGTSHQAAMERFKKLPELEDTRV